MLHDPARDLLHSRLSSESLQSCVQNTKFEHVSHDGLTSRPCLSTIIYGFLTCLSFNWKHLFSWSIDGLGKGKHFCADFFSCSSVWCASFSHRSNTKHITYLSAPCSWNHCEGGLASACTTQVMLLPKLCCWPTSCPRVFTSLWSQSFKIITFKCYSCIPLSSRVTVTAVSGFCVPWMFKCAWLMFSTESS